MTQVRQLQHHKSAVTDLSFDSAGEHLASCSADGAVVICSLYSDALARYDYPQPVKARVWRCDVHLLWSRSVRMHGAGVCAFGVAQTRSHACMS